MTWRNKTGRGIPLLSIILAVTALAPGTYAQPPDPNNAALLYYQAFLMSPKGQDQTRDMIDNLPYGVDPNSQVREYMKQCETALSLAEDASRLPACDWGLQYSRGPQMVLTHVSQMRSLARLIKAKICILIADGQYHRAFEQCLALRRMGEHVGDATIISFLVSVALDALAEKSFENTLSAMPPDAQTLSWFKGELAAAPRQLRLQDALTREEEITLARLDMDHKDWLIETVNKNADGNAPAEWIDRLKKADAAFFEGTRKYYQNHMNALRAVFDSPAPYAQKFSRLEALDKRPGTDAKENPHAMLAAAFIPSVSRVLTLDTRTRSNGNRLEAALEIYLVKARTGSPPNQLPAGAPKDPFTDQDFKYEKTKDGFRLSRWTDDPETDKTWQFEFKVK